MGVFLCNECGKNFEEEAYLYMHQSRTHDMNTIVCEQLFTEKTLNTNFVTLCVLWIFIFVLDQNIYSQRKHLKPISSWFLSWKYRFLLDLNNYWHREHLNQFCHALYNCVLWIFIFVLHLNTYSQREQLKLISSWFLSSKKFGLYWMWKIIHREKT